MMYPSAFILAASLIKLVFAVPPLVDVNYTKYLGSELPNGVSQWLGIRFAAPPVGNLRFRAPVDPLKNDTVQIADEVLIVYDVDPESLITANLAWSNLLEHWNAIPQPGRIRRLPLP